MVDHISISVKDYQASVQFYDKTLDLLGYARNKTILLPEKNIYAAGYGAQNKPSFWISPMGKDTEEIGKARGVHVAFVAPSAQAVDAWYTKCIELGGTDNGAPGHRPEYHPGYYGAFIVDPNGWRIEAVFHNFKK